MEVYEALGRTHHDLLTCRQAFSQTLELLDKVCRGEITTDRVLVNIAGGSWTLLPVEQMTPPAVAERMQGSLPAPNGQAEAKA